MTTRSVRLIVQSKLHFQVTGSLSSFVIEDRKPKKPTFKKPLIQELDDNEIKTTNKPIIQKENLEKKSPKIVENDEQISFDTIKTSTKQNYVIVKTEDQKSLIGLFYFPSSSITDFNVDVGCSRIIIENEKAETMVDLFLPHSVDKNNVIAHYDSKLHVCSISFQLT